MHNFFLKKYHFINEFEQDVLNKLDKDISIIYRNYSKKINHKLILKIKMFCKKKGLEFFLSNNVKLAIKLNLDGVYLPSFNNSLDINIYQLKRKFKIIGSAHNIKEIRIKEKQRVDEIFKKLPTDRILERYNWSIYDDPKLFQPVHSKPFVEFRETNPSKLFLRVERQTIRKLPIHGTVLFTIRVYVDPIESILNDKHALTSLKKAVENLSEPMKKYKSIDQFEKSLVIWLTKKLNNVESKISK